MQSLTKLKQINYERLFNLKIMIYSSKSQLYPNTNSRLRDASNNSKITPNLPPKVYISIK